MSEVEVNAAENVNQEGVENYNMQSLYTSKILPHINEIKKICKINNLPFFFSAAVKNEKGKTKYVNDGVLTGSNSIGLYNDMFEKFLLVMHGGKVTFQDELDEEAINYILDQMPGDENNIVNSNMIPDKVEEKKEEESVIEFIGDI